MTSTTHSWLTKRVLQDTDDQFTISKKRIILYGTLMVGVLTGMLAASRLTSNTTPSSFFFLPASVGCFTLIAFLFATRKLPDAAVLYVLYMISMSVVLNDWYGAQTKDMRTWPAQVLLIDIALVCKLRASVSYVLIGIVTLWLTVLLTEEAYRWGMFEVSLGNENVSRVTNCASPPCPIGFPSAFANYCNNLSILIFDFYFTRGFADGVQKEHEKMEAAIHATERIASSLSHFDLTSAEAVLTTSTLPEPLHDALKKILTNLEIYRPYLPDALFAEMHSNTYHCNMQAPGLETRRAALVFTDIQGSTATWEACPDGMRDGLKVHDTVMRECLAEHCGYEVKTIGDSFMVAFANAASAVQFGLSVQERLVYAMWPSALLELDHLQWIDKGPWCGLRVRVGVHCGEVDAHLNALTGRYDYFGNTVNKAARMEGACVGGAVAVTREVLAEVGHTANVSVIDMGSIELKGVTGGVPAYLLLPESLEGRRGYVEGQLQLDREDRKYHYGCGTSSALSSSKSSVSLASLQGTRQEQLQNRSSTTVGVVEAMVGKYESVETMTEVMNGVLTKVVTSTERTHGTVVSLQGSKVAVSWNAAKTCTTHVENSLVFVQLLGSGWGTGGHADLHIGMGSGSAVCGTVGCKRMKFVAVLGIGMEVATRLCTDAVNDTVLCYYACSVPCNDAGNDGFVKLKKIGMLDAPCHNAAMHLYLISINSDNVIINAF